MGILAPFFLAGLAGLALPVVFHLVRRVPKGRQPFSSLMFLSPTPPRLTRRSRLDQWLLLLLRLLALAAMAFAFARPFLRESALLTLNDLPSRRVALLVDVSASMRREDVWRRAIDAANKQLDLCAPQDQVALYAFSDRLTPIVSFRDGAGGDALRASGGAESLASREVARQALRELKPTWAQGDLGAALASVAAELDAASDVEQSKSEPQIVLVSDMARGTKLESLQSAEWPSRVRLSVQAVGSAKTTNATLHLVESTEDDAETAPRVRVVNAADSSRDQFQVRWGSDKPATKPGGASTDSNAEGASVYVPPGQSRVVRLPRPANNPAASYLELVGDDHDFDNRFYVVPPLPQKLLVAFAGEDKETDAQGAQFFLRSAVADDPLREIRFAAVTKEALEAGAVERPTAIVFTSASSPEIVDAVKGYVERGGVLLVAPDSVEVARSLLPLVEGMKLAETQPKNRDGDFVLLGEIDFTHPCFLPFANPRYNDFTKIHFWRHYSVKLADDFSGRVVARFDDETPWMIEQARGKGRVIWLTSGWRPDDSQFALSSKFVPYISALLDLASGSPPPLAGVVVGAPVLTSKGGSSKRSVKTPAGATVELGSDEQRFAATNEPGLYELAAGEQTQRFAVNVNLLESDTAPLELERLEQWGVTMGAAPARQQELERMRQQKDAELEGRQQIWRWLLVLSLGFLVVETFLGGILAKMRQSQEVVA